MDIDLEINFYKQKLEEFKDKLIHSIIDAIVDEQSFWKYYPMLREVIPVGGWIKSCPENLSVWFHQTEHREAVRYFDSLLESMEEYRDNLDLLVEFFGVDGIKVAEILKKNSTWDLMQDL